MTDERSNVVSLWMATVRDAVAKFGGASVEEQEVIGVGLGEEYGPEAAASARKLFKAERLKIVEAAQPKPWIRQFSKKPAVAAQPVAKPEIKVGRRYSWDEVVVPEGVSEVEALTYVPGLVGQIVEWIVSGARRPNRVMALGVALAVVGTLIGRRFEGPTGSATHLYVFILAPTGWGKDHPLWCGNKLMLAIGAKGLLGPSEFVSGRGIIKYLKRQPLALCIVDELGDMFQLIHSQKDNAWVTDLLGHFKKLYNPWQIINTAETMRDESVTINHPAVSIVGACTAQAFFEALKPADVEGGFANRAMLLPFEGIRRPPERDVPEEVDEPPKGLVAELKELVPKPKPMDMNKTLGEISEGDEPAPPVPRNERQKIRWDSDEAKVIYFRFSKEVDQWEGKDKQKFELGRERRSVRNECGCWLLLRHS
jgi:hypothetical protein